MEKPNDLVIISYMKILLSKFTTIGQVSGRLSEAELSYLRRLSSGFTEESGRSNPRIFPKLAITQKDSAEDSSPHFSKAFEKLLLKYPERVSCHSIHKELFTQYLLDCNIASTFMYKEIKKRISSGDWVSREQFINALEAIYQLNFESCGNSSRVKCKKCSYLKKCRKWLFCFTVVLNNEKQVSCDDISTVFYISENRPDITTVKSLEKVTVDKLRIFGSNLDNISYEDFKLSLAM